jgi:hydroxyacylglutathione hydrolase
MFFKQIQRHGDNFSYVIADERSREAVVVDPSYNAGEISSVIKAGNLRLKYVIDTHGHSDHTAGNEELRSTFKALIVAHKISRVDMDAAVDDGDILRIGTLQIKIIHTPGHSADSICLLVDSQKLLTGDLPGGNFKSMYNSLFNKIAKLDDSIEVYPGHDYGSKSFSTIGEEKRENYTLKPRSIAEFIDFMKQP